jgi:protein-S-isoprenylcysteine O-methyltransferase Ste14
METVSGNLVQRGGHWVLWQSVLMCAVVAGGVLWRGQWHARSTTLGGLFLFLIGAGCGLVGTAGLGRNLSPFPKPLPGGRLVQTGIYGVVRHPLYVAVFCLSLSWALLWGSWPALFVALTLAPFFDAKARREEHWLREQFSDYARYEQRVKRFIPWVY